MVCDQPVALTDVVNADIIDASGILDDPEVQQRLLPLLPEGQQTEEELREIVRDAVPRPMPLPFLFFIWRQRFDRRDFSDAVS